MLNSVLLFFLNFILPSCRNRPSINHLIMGNSAGSPIGGLGCCKYLLCCKCLGCCNDANPKRKENMGKKAKPLEEMGAISPIFQSKGRWTVTIYSRMVHGGCIRMSCGMVYRGCIRISCIWGNGDCNVSSGSNGSGCGHGWWGASCGCRSQRWSWISGWGRSHGWWVGWRARCNSRWRKSVWRVGCNGNRWHWSSRQRSCGIQVV